jgi:hypothetical protein
VLEMCSIGRAQLWNNESKSQYHQKGGGGGGRGGGEMTQTLHAHINKRKKIIVFKCVSGTPNYIITQYETWIIILINCYSKCSQCWTTNI